MSFLHIHYGDQSTYYWFTVITTTIACGLSVFIVGFLRRQSKLAYKLARNDDTSDTSEHAVYPAGESPAERAAKFVILPDYKPIIQFQGFAFFMLLVVLVGDPAVLTGGVPAWFASAQYSSGVHTNTDSMRYFTYWFLFELLIDGFGILFFQKKLTSWYYLSALRYSVVFAAVMSAITVRTPGRANLAFLPQSHPAVSAAEIHSRTNTGHPVFVSVASSLSIVLVQTDVRL